MRMHMRDGKVMALTRWLSRLGPAALLLLAAATMLSLVPLAVAASDNYTVEVCPDAQWKVGRARGRGGRGEGGPASTAALP